MMHHAMRRLCRERRIGLIDRGCHPLRRKPLRRPNQHGGDSSLGRNVLEVVKVERRRICHHRAHRLHIRVDRRIHPRARRAQAPDDAAGGVVKRQHGIRGDGNAAADQDLAESHLHITALLHPWANREIRRRIKADQLYCD